LFVYSFAPDEPDRKYEWKSGYYYYDYTDDDEYRNSYIYDFEATTNDRFAVNDEPNTSDFVDASSFTSNQYNSTNQINRMTWMFKYQGNEIDSGLDDDDGPNYMCSTTKITPLTTSETTIDDAIDDMQADGMTNIQQGLTWGWRTLSDNAPFTAGRENSNNQNMKYIILLTDGNNTYRTDGDSTPLLTAYGAWGYAYPDKNQNRWIDGLSSSDLAGTIYASTSFDTTPESSNDFESIMNAHTLQSCINAKADGISIFTIAFDVSDGSSVKALLDECAGSGIKNGEEVVADGDFYFDVDGNGLDDAMASIAAQIGDLRIVR